MTELVDLCGSLIGEVLNESVEFVGGIEVLDLVFLDGGDEELTIGAYLLISCPSGRRGSPGRTIGGPRLLARTARVRCLLRRVLETWTMLAWCLLIQRH